MADKVKIILFLAPPSLKNNFGVTKTGHFYTKPAIKQWQENAVKQILGKHRYCFEPSDELVYRSVTYYPNRRRDLDREAVWDVLQKAGVIHNDRQFVEEHNYKRFDKANPRVEIEIEKAPSSSA